MDRLFAIYLAMYPNATLTPVEEGYGTFVLPPYSFSKFTTPLEPFASNGAWYTSESSWSTIPFNYTYPELLDWTQTPDALRKNVTSIVNTMYNPNAKASRKGKRDLDTEWSVSIKAAKFDVGGERYVVRVFVGEEPSGDANEWGSSTGYVGSFQVIPPHVKSNSTSGLPNLVAYSEIRLTGGLLANGLDGGDLEKVVEYLKQNLYWRIQKVGYFSALLI